MKVSDYLVDFFLEKGIKDFFGYQGTMIMHFVDSVGKKSDAVNHVCYNEQGAAFAACGYAKATGGCAVAYATSGPGAINLMSGIADAYYDSVPVIFISGQVNLSEYNKDVPDLRQQAFQQTDVVKMAKGITKDAVFVESAQMLYEKLGELWELANYGRKGPVLLDIPMDIQRAELPDDIIGKKEKTDACRDDNDYETICDDILSRIQGAKAPVLLLGNGILKTQDSVERVRSVINKLKIPVITTLLGKGLVEDDSPYDYGVVGAAYGHRYTNWILHKKTDLIVSLGASLVRRQTGGNSREFAKDAAIIRVDIDDTELKRRVHDDEIQISADVNKLLSALDRALYSGGHEEWLIRCGKIKSMLQEYDRGSPGRQPNQLMERISRIGGDDSVFAVDVGQHMMWAMQSLRIKDNRVLFSGGHGAMGFALPAAIGAFYGNGGKKNTICIAGDGAFQMNIQELQWLVRDNIPVCVIVLNNRCLGLIRQQQEDFFDSNFIGALSAGGYSSPSFADIAKAYGIKSVQLHPEEEPGEEISSLIGKEPVLIEYLLEDDTVAVPKTFFGTSVLNQKPYIPEEMINELEDI